MISFIFSVLVTFSFVLLETRPDHERRLKIGTINSFHVISNCFIMSTCALWWTHTHTQCRTSLASRHSVFNDRDKKKWERQTKFSLWKMIRKRNSEIQQMFRWYHTCTLDFIDVKITKEEVKWKNSMLGANGFRLFFTICQIKWFWCSMNLNLYRFEQLQSGFRECRWDFNFQQANDSWQSHVHI